MKLVFILSFLIVGIAFADDCPDCDKFKALEAEMAKVKPQPMDYDTSKIQDRLTEQADDLMKANLTAGRLNSDSATPLVMMIWHIIPYDNAGYLLENHQKAFKALYKAPNSVLAKAIDEMVAKGSLSHKDRKSLLNDFGIKAK